MQYSIHHDLSSDVAHDRIDQAFAYYSQQYAQYKPQMAWNSPVEAQVSLTNGSTAVTGTLELRDHEIFIDLNLPFALRLFQGRIRQSIDDESSKWLGAESPA